MTWQACPSGHAGCNKLVVDWIHPTSTAMSTIGAPRREAGHLVGGTPYLVYQRRYPKDLLGNLWAIVDVVVPIAAPFTPIFAIGSPGDASSLCADELQVGDAGVGFYVTPNSGPATYTFGSSSLASPQTVQTLAAATPAQFGATQSGGAQHMAVGATSLFFETFSPNSVAVLDLGSNQFHVPLTPSMLTGESPLAVPDGALVANYTQSYSVALLAPDASYSTLITPTSPHQVTGFAVDRSDSNALVWVESDGNAQATDSVIWTAPYATSAGALQRRKVAAIQNDVLHDGGADIVVNAGVMVNLLDVNKALITRLSDGMGWIVNAEPGDAFGGPVWIDANEVWFTTADASLQTPRSEPTGMVRISRASLGSPTVTPGF